MKLQILSGLILASLCSLALADAANEVDQLQHSWAHVNYELDGDAQLEAFAALADTANSATQAYPDDAGVWIWSGIIKSTFAGAKGGLGALGLAKESKRDLEQAMKLDADALDGSAYASLGTLYYSVPGWPVGFGDDKKAEELLQKALALKPDAIDNNYFYASYLVEKKRYDEARDYFTRAQNAPARPNRPVADAGRQQEIKLALEDLQGRH